MVMIFTSGELTVFKNAYRVVVLPEPVGPVVKIMPVGRESSFFISSRRSSRKPKSSRFKEMVLGFNTRSTTFSP